MNAPLKIAAASALALAVAAPTSAQPQPYYGPTYNQPYTGPYQPTPQYQQDLQRYRSGREAYESARREYRRRIDDYNRARADYDARYGYGAYVRRYGPPPAWDESRWAYYAPPESYYAPSAPYYGAESAYIGPQARCDRESTLPAGIIGAIAGALLGSNVAARNARTEGAVLGGVVGAGIGAAVGQARDRYRCDQRGPYFTYNETIPYRESARLRSDRYTYYQRMGCRLAPAPIDAAGTDYRYVRVCPDAEGRYRILA